jgi:hypothetical protein
MKVEVMDKKVRELVADILDLIIYVFASWFMQEMLGSPSRVYCFFAQPTKSSVLV